MQFSLFFFFPFLTGGRGFSPILGGSWLTENAEKGKVKEFLNGNEVQGLPLEENSCFSGHGGWVSALKIISIFWGEKMYPSSKIWAISRHIMKTDGAVWTPWHFLQFCSLQLCSICFCHTVRKSCQVTWDTSFLKSPRSCPIMMCTCSEDVATVIAKDKSATKDLGIFLGFGGTRLSILLCTCFFLFQRLHLSTYSFLGLDADVLNTILGFSTWLRLEKRLRY